MIERAERPLEENLARIDALIARATGMPGPVEVLRGLAATPTRELAEKLFPGQEIGAGEEGQAVYIRAYAKVALHAYLHGFARELYEHL